MHTYFQITSFKQKALQNLLYNLQNKAFKSYAKFHFIRSKDTHSSHISFICNPLFKVIVSYKNYLIIKYKLQCIMKIAVIDSRTCPFVSHLFCLISCKIASNHVQHSQGNMFQTFLTNYFPKCKENVCLLNVLFKTYFIQKLFLITSTENFFLSYITQLHIYCFHFAFKCKKHCQHFGSMKIIF